jgi:hypothetical protein
MISEEIPQFNNNYTIMKVSSHSKMTPHVNSNSDKTKVNPKFQQPNVIKIISKMKSLDLKINSQTKS